MKHKLLRLKIRLLLVFAPNDRIDQIGEWMAEQIEAESMKGEKE
jgi:hypothetical protein